jgi:hypothetical protein
LLIIFFYRNLNNRNTVILQIGRKSMNSTRWGALITQEAKFGLLIGLLVAVCFTDFRMALNGGAITYWPWMLCIVIYTFSVIWPKPIRPLYGLWVKLGSRLGEINSTILLSIIFFGFITPVAVFQRRGRLPRNKLQRILRENIEKSQFKRPF